MTPTLTTSDRGDTARGTRPPGRRPRWRLADALPLAVLVALVLAVTARQPEFVGAKSLGALLDSTSPILLLALGQTFVILTGGIDLSIATLASLGTVLLARWVPPLGVGGVLLMLAALTAAGLLTGVVSAVAQIPTFIVSLGALGLWSGVAYVLSDASSVGIEAGYDAIGWVRDYEIARVPLGVWLAILLALAITVGMRVLARGRSLHALGLAERASLMSGRPTGRIRVAAFGASGLFAGLAAILLAASQFSGAPTLADSLLLPVIASVVLGGSAITGGVGGPLRTLIGALIVAVLRVGLSAVGVDPTVQQIVYGTAVILAVALTIDRRRVGVVK